MVGVGVIPLLTATSRGISADDDDFLSGARERGTSASASAMQLWQNPPGTNIPTSSAYLTKSMPLEHASLLQEGGGVSASGDLRRPLPSLVGVTTCQDCGNQAKKDCSHRRCRTCCKSRGYDCATHVKSTWVPAARRRERQLVVGNAGAIAGTLVSTSGTKKPRVGVASHSTTASHTSTSDTTPPRSFETSSRHQGARLKESLPRQVRVQALFKCVRVTAVDDGDDEYAYQAVVRIGGHVFKGFLYDQGFEGSDGLPNLAELHLGGGVTSSPPVNLDPSDHIYEASGGSYGNPIN